MKKPTGANVSIKIEIHKILESIRKLRRDNKKRRDLDRINNTKECLLIAEDIMAIDYFINHFKKKLEREELGVKE